jgi:phage terminase small subunit
MESIKVVFAILMIQNGSTIEMVPTDGLSDCLKQKRIIARNIGEEQQGIYMNCREVEAVVYEDMGRLKIKKIIECALEAGYAEGSAHVRASELRNANKYPLVAKYIGELREEIQKKYEITFEKHITELGRIRQEALAKGAFSAATNAEVARGKAAGLYIEQKIIRTGKLEDMSIEELEAKMKRIYDENKTLIEGEYTLGKEE